MPQPIPHFRPPSGPVHIQALRNETVRATKEMIAEAVLELYSDLDFLPKTREGLLAHYEKTGYLKDLDDYENVYSDEHGAFLVLLEEGRVVGCGGIRRIDKENGELARLWLAKRKRGQGLGRELFERLMQAAEERGYARIYLDTSERCVDALKLFRKNGFVDCGQYKESIGDIFLCREMGRGNPPST